MIPIDQTELFPPEHPFVGNSLRACLASILEKDIEEIPPFGLSLNFDWDGWGEFLKSHGLISFVIPIDPTYYLINREKIEGHVIGYKLTPHEGREKRSAIIIDDGRITHDPYPTDGLVKKLVSSGVFVGRLL